MLNPFTPVVANTKVTFFLNEYKTQTKYHMPSNFFEHVLYILGSNSDKKD